MASIEFLPAPWLLTNYLLKLLKHSRHLLILHIGQFSVLTAKSHGQGGFRFFFLLHPVSRIHVFYLLIYKMTAVLAKTNPNDILEVFADIAIAHLMSQKCSSEVS